MVLVVLLSCVLLPLEWIASLFLSAETIDSTLRAFRYGASTFVPFMLVTLCRYFDVNMFESAFFAGLARRDATLAEQIQKVKTHSLAHVCMLIDILLRVDLQKEAVYWDWEYVQHLLTFTLRQAAFALLAFLASPLIGVVIPLLRFGYRYVLITDH